MPSLSLRYEDVFRDPESQILQPGLISLLVGVAPEPSSAVDPEPVLFCPRPLLMTNCAKEPPIPLQPCCHLLKETRLLFERHMNDRVERDDCIESASGKAD